MGSGKSSLLKGRFLNVSKKQKLCYALIKKDLGNYPYESNFKKYVQKACFLSDTLFIIDEAYTAIPKKEPDPTNQKKKFDFDLCSWFINSRKCNNAIFIVFHGMAEIPVWLLKYTTYVIRFTTTDQLQFQKMRFTSFPKVVESIVKYPVIPKYNYHEIKLR